MPSPGKKWFVAQRGDGLGARLAAMVDALWLARQFDGRFAFHWPNASASAEYNAIGAPTAMFAAEFLAEYHVELSRLRSLSISPLQAVQADFKAALAPGSGIDGFRIHWLPLSRQARELRHLAPIGSDRRDAFRSIGFSPPLEQARQLADAVPIAPGTVALHLRAGDIVYGRYRASGCHHDKVIAYPVALELLLRSAEAGKRILVFGQDRALCDHAARTWGAIVAEDLLEGVGLDHIAQAVFEIALMGRCDDIIAGTSAFSLLAAKIAGVELRAPRRLLPPAHAKAAIIQALRQPQGDFTPSPLQRAMAAWHAVMAGGHDLDDPECRSMIAEAIRHDPANPYYLAVQAVAQYRAGDAARAEATLLSALAGPQVSPALVQHLIAWLPQSPVLSSPATVAQLDERARDGFPGAALLLALRARVARRAEDYAAYSALFRDHRSAEMPQSAEEFFEAAGRPKVPAGAPDRPARPSAMGCD